ncbi:MAG: valine--tRNA ligase [Rhodoferax sp.]|nr:valine--tRNA ligase [Rhodoferax sp.]
MVFDFVQAGNPSGIGWDVWYCNSHLQALRERHHARVWRRYAVPARTAHLVVGELEGGPASSDLSPERSPDPDWQVIRERFFGTPLGVSSRLDAGERALDAPVVYPAFLRAPKDRLDEVGRWYEEEHLPLLLDCPQWLMTRRFRIDTPIPGGYTHLALHYLSDLRALQSPQRDAARNTPWRDSLIAEGWFAPEYRVCYRVHDPLVPQASQAPRTDPRSSNPANRTTKPAP